ncbi:MAG: signal transduction protein [Deltaproteobacteria bacterium]|nr:signal transduction protein [Deltaproteobacteria bacterium]
MNVTPVSFDLMVERNILGQAMLNATAAMASLTDPETVLRTVCDVLAEASPHIRLVWTRFCDHPAGSRLPNYLAGTGVGSFEQLGISARTLPSVEDAFHRWEAVSVDHQDPSGGLCREGFCSAISMPVGHKGVFPCAIVTITADMQGYFEQVGTSLFKAFIHLANVTLDRILTLQELNHLATHDQLTGIMNRRGVQEFLEKEIARCRRWGKKFSVVLFDLDRFKLINDRLGHQEGDIVLQKVAELTNKQVRQEDCLGRWGGEEFICVVTETPRKDALLLAERMRLNMKTNPVATVSGAITVTASFGVASFPEDADSLDKLLSIADTALNDAKMDGRDRTVSAADVRHDIFNIGNMLDVALRENRIVAAYQPIMDLRSGTVIAEEALARLLTPGGEIMAAGRFVPAASQLQLMHQVDLAMIMQVFSHCVTGLRTGSNRLIHFVNVSTDLLRHRDLIDKMLEAAYLNCQTCADLIGEVKPIVIEITEHELLTDISAARDLLRPFMDFGFRLALDDFGSGYSSYQYLVDLPISFIKIDGFLTRRIAEKKVRAIIQGIQDTADQLGITTVAEFVENAETETILKDIGVNWAQGYYYGKPVIPSETGHPGNEEQCLLNQDMVSRPTAR